MINSRGSRVSGGVLWILYQRAPDQDTVLCVSLTLSTMTTFDFLMYNRYYLNNETVQFIIEQVALLNEEGPSSKQYAHTPQSLLRFRMDHNLQQSMREGRIDTVTLLYSHGYRLPYLDRHFKDAHEDLAVVLLSGKIHDSNEYLRVRKRSAGVDTFLLQNIVIRKLDKCVSLILNESEDPEYHLRLLSYATGYNNLKYTVQILDRGMVTVNDYKQHFYRAVSRGHYEIVAEFIRRRVSYDRYNLVDRLSLWRYLESDTKARMHALVLSGGW